MDKFKKFVVDGAGAFALGALLTLSGVYGYDFYKSVKLSNLMEKEGCRDLGPPNKGSSSADVIKHGYLCGQTLVIIPK